MIEEDQAIIEAYKAFKKGYTGELHFQAYYNYVVNWDIYPIKFKEKVVGAVFTSGNKIHVAANGPWFPRQYIKKIVLPMIEKYGIIETSVDDYNVSGLDWVMKLGFKPMEKLKDKTKLVLTKGDIWVS